MGTSECKRAESLAEEYATKGENRKAMEMFTRAADCWSRWESYAKSAAAYERAYEHAMLVNDYATAANLVQESAEEWIKNGNYDKFEMGYQVASEAYIMAAEAKKDPRWLVEGAFCSIVGGDLDMTRQLIHAAMQTTRGRFRELINLALMLSEYHFGDADLYIKAAVARVLDKSGVQKMMRLLKFVFAGFVRTTLESEMAVTISNLVESTGLADYRVRELINECIRKGWIPASLDSETDELVVDPDRYDLEDLTRRKAPIMSRSLKDPGAWDVENNDGQ